LRTAIERQSRIMSGNGPDGERHHVPAHKLLLIDRVEALENRTQLLHAVVTAQHTENGLLLERIEMLEKRNAAHTTLQEALIFILSTEPETASDEVKREAFRSIMSGAKQNLLLADLERVKRDASVQNATNKRRELLRRAGLHPPVA
jgi:hypothetical protein